ncbi:PfkB family carbohydrate kinase [Zhenpiania hominis]|uniref:Carbohydrate kinase PfkB domain-containing protein n=1 Tax=Zhenpiania hominis TaxID=2763644 RepID=A0A923NN19_9FIRM|nr:hypothetical protein [Zhenpiania hominis]
MLNKRHLQNISIAVIGDYFLDRFIYIDTNRTNKSLYGNGPVYHVNEVRKYAGAAGTIAKNLANLGVGHIYAIGFIGNDSNGVDLRNSMTALGIDCEGLIVTDACITPTYTMVLQKGSVQSEICEYDYLNDSVTPIEIQKQISSAIYKLANENDLDAIIALDQLDTEDCGVITSLVAKTLSYIGNKKIVCFDSRKHIGKVKNAIIKCNYKEFMESELYDSSITFQDSCKKISKETGQTLIVTKDKEGAFIVVDGKVTHIPAREIEQPIDSRGAGDAFTSGFVTAFCCGTSLYTSGLIGAVTASLCVTEIGTTGRMLFDDVMNTYERWRNHDSFRYFSKITY